MSDCVKQIGSKGQLGKYLLEQGIPAPANRYHEYTLALKTWMEPETSEGKKRIKTSVIWKVLKRILPIYRGLRGFLSNCVHRGIREAFGQLIQRMKRIKYLQRKKNRSFLHELMPDEATRRQQREESQSWQLYVSILVPLYNTPENYLRDMIASVQSQTYERWQLCLADGSDGNHDYVGRICQEYAQTDSRIVYQRLEQNTGICGNTNACIRMAKREYLAFFDHDDMLHPSAIYECVKAIRQENAEFVYTDELTFFKDRLEDIVTRHYKPDFSPENLRGVNYICHLSVFKKSLLDATGLLDQNYEGSQDHDMILKLTSTADKVCHIPKILYFWRVHPASVSMDIGAKEYAIAAGRNAVHDNEVRLGHQAEVVSTCICATHYRLVYQLQGQPLVSIILLGSQEGQINPLLSSIYERTTYENYEVCIASSIEKALEAARGEYVAFLQEDMDVTMPDWIQMLLMYVQQAGVGMAAGRLAARDGKLWEAGYITGLDQRKLVTPIGRGERYSDLGYMGRMYYAHNVSACSLHGTIIRRNMSEALISLKKSGITSMRYLGLGLCSRFREEGYRIVLNPYVVFLKDEPESIDERELKHARKMLGFEADPYYNPNLSKDGKWKA